MDIKELEKKLDDSIEIFRYEAEARRLNYPMGEKLSGYAYDEICRQAFYVFDDFKKNIIKYLESQEK